MPATQPLLASPNSAERVHRPMVRRRPKHIKRSAHRAIALEAGIKLATNAIFAALAMVAFVKLLPQAHEQSQSLELLTQDVAVVSDRVEQLQHRFDRHFDPQQARSVMQEQSNRVAADQIQVIWMTPDQSQAAQPAFSYSGMN